MQYFGGKSRVAKKIARIINRISPKVYCEPFCGSCWVGELVQAEARIMSDVNTSLITMWRELQKGWTPPLFLSESEYRCLKNNMDIFDPLTAFAGFGCSFAGKFFGGYARSYDHDNPYSYIARSSLLRRIPKLQDCEFISLDYSVLLDMEEVELFYLDPPYANTTKYYGTPPFDSGRFWELAERAAKHSIVIVSEYECPSSFVPLSAMVTRTSIRDKSGHVSDRVEYLFVDKGHIDFL